MSVNDLHRDWWESFCHQHEKTENEMKSFLFKGELSKKEFETLVDCSRQDFITCGYFIDYGKLFASCPRLIECCNWTRLDELSWTVLLSQKPEFAEKCDKWNEFDGYDWSTLLGNQPEFADRCTKFDKFDGEDWSRLLRKQPQFEDKCNWRKFKGGHWHWLLEEQPQFANKCDKWNEFAGGNWGKLLSSKPQFADKCNKWDEFRSNIWGYLLGKQPKFADKCDKWDEFEGGDWANLLSAQPQFADKCDKWDEFKDHHWAALLYSQPQFANKCDKWDKITSWNWAILLEKQPQFADKCDVWDYFDAHEWRSLLAKHPQFVDKCAKSSIVVNVLIKHPQFTEHCNTSIITEKGKAKLLAKHPDLAKYFSEKIELKAVKKKQIKNKLVALLLENENAEVAKEEFETLTGSDLVQLLSEKPHIADKYDCYEAIDDIGISVTINYWAKLTAKQWCNLLIKQPQFANKCDKWEFFRYWDQENLLEKHPDLAKYFKNAEKKVDNNQLELF